MLNENPQVFQRWNLVLIGHHRGNRTHLAILLPAAREDEVCSPRELWWYIFSQQISNGHRSRPVPADIGGTLYGPWLRYCILTSITVSQLGFVSAYTIFVSENLQVR